MLSYKPVFDEFGELQYIETSLTGHELLDSSKLNKEFAFTKNERSEFNLLGKLPFTVETLQEQADRIYKQYLEAGSHLEKNIYLNDLHDKNEVLFYKVVADHLKEMLPIIYTPTMGTVIEHLSLQIRHTRGLYLSYPERNSIATILDNRLNPEIDIIVMTDGERILGLGDQGACGMMIPIAKLMVYVLCGGVNPYKMLPIQLDVGTNNQRLLDDPLYYGWRHARITGKEYDDFIESVVTTIKEKFPNVFLHWEDFGKENARRNLERFRNKMCTFNDDMQGTGAVTLAAVLAAVNVTNTPLKDHRIILFGAGTAGLGIADQLQDAMMRDGLSAKEACERFYLIDQQGLLLEDTPDLMAVQKCYTRKQAEVCTWEIGKNGKIGLYEAVKYIKPTILIGTSAQGGAFTQEIVELMCSYVERPIIFPLSNPTEKSEAIPSNLLVWSNGKALVATGSPFEPVNYNGELISISQCNNAFIFPAIGQAVIISKAKRLSQDMIWEAAKTLSHWSPTTHDPKGSLLPDIENIHRVSCDITLQVVKQAIKEGLAQIPKDIDVKLLVDKSFWQPRYVKYRKV